MLSDTFVLMSVGWCNAGTNYVAIHLTYPASTDCRFSFMCVAFSPLYEKLQSAAQHVNLINFVLWLFGKSCFNVVSITADKCAVSKFVAELLCYTIFGCASQHFNLLISNIIIPRSKVIEKVLKVMDKLFFPMHCATLRKFTDFARWNQTTLSDPSWVRYWLFVLRSVLFCQTWRPVKLQSISPRTAKTVPLTNSCVLWQSWTSLLLRSNRRLWQALGPTITWT